MGTKKRVFEGQELPENLYQHQRKIANRWRYKKANGTFFHFEAPTDQAIALATQLNLERSNPELPTPQARAQKAARTSFERHVEDFIGERESRDPYLARKASWRDRKGYLRRLSKDFAHTSVTQVTLLDMQKYWDKFTGNAQRARRAEFKRFFNHLITRELCPKLKANPFSTDDSKPQVAMRARAGKRRLRLSIEQFWSIYHHAGNKGWHFLQTAMGISLVTTMRRGDICDLRFDEHVASNYLRKQINKSHAQLSQAEFRADPSNLSWNLDEQPILRKLINDARETSLKHARCPYIIHFRPKRKIKGDSRKHANQVLPDYLTRAFAETRDECGDFNSVSPSARPSFHEIRALGSHLFNKAFGEERRKDVQLLMAHTDEKITRHYQQGHETHWTEVELSLPTEILKGQF
ncbi:hypothetical protein HBA55_35075 [Pseudomaricurvus alkylphenolicus]|uniref:hypothetical protein n=1 Tax=Pseudomaricurvus alkylphenolicus TaxID=1306991 RepID=UPI00141FC11A|nr:hypothetical protein [Pseudomaricurvus alkylphenolicus]NIB44857.1 hypothetical protein [Pseudomaricurvus alkylphenolicus]